jgi:hypothetical protein
MSAWRWCAVGAAMVGLLIAGCAGPEQAAKPEAGAAAKPGAEVSEPAPKPTPAAAPMLQPAPDERDRPFAVVSPVTEGLVIDGVIEDAWGQPAIDTFVDTAAGKPVDWKTRVWLRYDADNLYIAAKMDEPDMSELVCMVTDRDGDVWQDDALEIFLDPTNTHKDDVYYHLMVNAAGTLADRQGKPDAGGLDYAWDAKGAKVKASKGKDYWAIEMALPLADLGVKGSVAGQHWAANFCRTRHGNIMEAAWSNTGPETFHAPTAFGHIAFR